MPDKMTNAKVKQYELLKIQQKMIERRLTDLRKEILVAAMESGNAIDPNTFEFLTEEHVVTVKNKTRNDVNELELEGILLAKGLWNLASKEVIDHDLVEQLYLEGRLTDSDLRSIRVPKSILSLHVEAK